MKRFLPRKLIAVASFLSVVSLYGGIALPASFHARFVQTVTSPDKAVIRYEGEVLFNRPARVKWIYRKPTPKEVCSDGRDVLVVDHDLEQVSRYRLREGFSLAEVLQRAEPIKPHIYTARYKGKTYTVRTDAKGNVDSVAFFDDADNKVQLLFRDIRTSKRPIPDTKLRCDYPRTYDVIEG